MMSAKSNGKWHARGRDRRLMDGQPAPDCSSAPGRPWHVDQATSRLAAKAHKDAFKCVLIACQLNASPPLSDFDWQVEICLKTMLTLQKQFIFLPTPFWPP